MTDTGHLFLTRGDLRRLACDAWALPTDAAGTVSPEWLSDDVELARVVAWAAPLGGIRTEELGPAPHSDATIWRLDTGGVRNLPLSWYLEAVEEFVGAAADGSPSLGRERRLIGLPLIATGAGGATERSGKVALELVELLQTRAHELNIDIVLVTRTATALAATQQARRRTGLEAWNGLGPQLREHAARLATLARDRQLVLFLGAGASAGAGLPLWNGLINELADGTVPDDQRDAFGDLDPLDQARVLEMLGGPDVKRRVAKRFSGEAQALAHQLLASLGVAESATTNYDRRYESALRDLHKKVAVLPGGRAQGQRWLLKLHGDVENESSIVLTRDDYLQYDSTRRALAGIVQALLITRHMLFVGFSLDDPNFHRIVHEVRTAIDSSDQDAPFGTALTLEDSALRSTLWKGDVELVPTDSPRQIEILLDFLLDQATTAGSYLLDEDYSDLLTDHEQALAASLREVRAGLQPDLLASPLWAELEAGFRRLGLRDETT